MKPACAAATACSICLLASVTCALATLQGLQRSSTLSQCASAGMGALCILGGRFMQLPTALLMQQLHHTSMSYS